MKCTFNRFKLSLVPWSARGSQSEFQFGQLFANLDRLVVSENICICETHFCQ